MKRKLIVTLVATALELYAATAAGQTAGQCTLVGTATSANGSTVSSVGPLNPVDGFPEYVTDSTGLAVQRCLDPNFCFFDPIVPTDPFSLQIGSGGEAFYWGADAVLDDGVNKSTIVMAAETAFLQAGPNDEPLNGSQFPFLRLRFVLGVPADGTYTVVHPFGVDKFTVTGATGARDVFATVDRGMSPNSTIQGPVGPWLKWDPANLAPGAVIPPGFLADGGPTAGSSTVIGSPCGTNFVRITGVGTNGAAVVFANGQTKLETNLFNVQGKIYDGKVQTPIGATRLTYSRSVAGAGQIETFGQSTATAQISVVDGPTIPVGTSRIAAPVTLDHTAVSPTAGINSIAVPVADASALPPIVSLTATDSTVTDATTLNLPLVDYVDIASAEFDPSTNKLTVTARSGDLRAAPTLTLRDFGTFAAGQDTLVVDTVAPPGVVHVDSAKGGTATALVRVVSSVGPTAPTGLVAAAATSATVSLSWTDTSNNENGFNIYTVAASGARTLVAAVGANATRAVISGLQPATAYTFQVDAFNNAGASSSNTLTTSTLALPVAPTGVTVATAAAQRTLTVSWTDAATDETGYQVYRSVNGAAFSLLTTRPAGSTSYDDATAAGATTYAYRVVAVRGPDSSDPATSASLLTPSAPTSPGTPTTVATATSVTVNWADRATNEASYQVYRSTTAAGGFAPVGGVLPANTVSFVDSTVVTGTQYFYRVDVSNWAATAPSAVSAGVTPQNTPTVSLLAPGNLAATPTTGNPPALSWTDTSTGETGFRVQRRSVTLSNAGNRTNGTFTTVGTTAANAQAFTDTARTANAIIEYSVAPVNGATLGPATTVLAVPGGIPGVTTAPTFTRTGNTVTVRWAQAGTNATNRAGIGGYSVQRCTVTAADNCAAGSAGWAQVASVNGRTTVTATNTVTQSIPARTYRYRVVSTTGPNAVTGVTGTPSPASNTLVR